MANDNADTPRVSTLNLLKEIADVTKQYGLLILMVVVIFRGDLVKQWASQAGITKFGDIEFTEQDADLVEASQEELQDAQVLIGELRTELAATHETLQAARGKVEDSGLQAQINKQLDMTDKAVAAASQGTRQIETALTNPEPVIDKTAQLTQKTASTGAIVFGADSDLASAQHEIKQAKKKQLGQDILGVYLRKGSYRSVALFPDRQEAKKQLEKFREKTSTKPFVVNFEKWCPTPQQKEDYKECQK